MAKLELNTSTVFSKNSENEAWFLSRLKQGHIVFELGVYQGIQGNAQHINIQNLIGDTFTVSTHDDLNGLIGLGYFLDGNCWNGVQISYGFNAFYLAPTAVSGEVVQENIFTNLSYRYYIEHFPIYAIARGAVKLKSSKYALMFDAVSGQILCMLTVFKNILLTVE